MNERLITAFQGTRRRIIACAVALLLLVVGGGAVAIVTGALDVHRVDVQGLVHLQRNEVLAKIGVKSGTSLALVNTGDIAHRVGSSPWISAVRVERRWPHVLRVTVTERRAVALMQTADNRWASVASDRMVVDLTAQPQAQLPVLLGFQAPESLGTPVDRKADAVVQVATALPPSLVPKVTQILADSTTGDIRLGLPGAVAAGGQPGGTIVDVGDTSLLGDKLTAAATVLANADPKTIAVLDVKVPHFPVVTPPSPKASPQKSSPTSSH